MPRSFGRSDTLSRAFTVGLIVSGLFVAAGLRNMFAPGFLSMSPRQGSGVSEIVAGLIILTLTLVGWFLSRPGVE